jgi:hypothetical protein
MGSRRRLENSSVKSLTPSICTPVHSKDRCSELVSSGGVVIWHLDNPEYELFIWDIAVEIKIIHEFDSSGLLLHTLCSSG